MFFGGGFLQLDLPEGRLLKTCVQLLQGDKGGKVNILGGSSINPCDNKTYTNMCRVLNGY